MGKLKQSSVLLMLVILFTKIIGMFRDIVLANYFGTTNVSDAYLIAASVPTLLFYFIGHALSTAYIPMYNKVRTSAGAEKAERFSNTLLNVSLLLSTLIVLLLLLFPHGIIKVFATGFDTATAGIAARMIRLSAPSLYAMSAVSILTGYLQANNCFLPPAAVSLPRNIAIILSIVLASFLGIDYLGLGLLAAHLLEFLFLVPFARKEKYHFKLTMDLKDPFLPETIQMVVPIIIGVCVGQINKIIDRSMASSVTVGGISALTYASIINTAVQGVLVTGIITILFAKCSELVAKGEHAAVKQRLSDTLDSLIFLLVPACFGIIILARPIVSLVLCRGAFDQHSLDLTVGALRCYTLGLLFLALRDTLVKIFYAYKDTKSTTIVSTVSIALNIVLNLILGCLMGINGLALATSISAIFNGIVLYILLRKKAGSMNTKHTAVVLFKSLIGSLGMAFFTNLLWDSFSASYSGLLSLLFVTILSCLLYFIIELLLANAPIAKLARRFIPTKL